MVGMNGVFRLERTNSSLMILRDKLSPNYYFIAHKLWGKL